MRASHGSAQPMNEMSRCLLKKLIFVTVLWLFLLSGPASFAKAQTQIQQVNGQTSSPNVTFKIWVDPAERIVVTQQVDLNIEIATDSYFVGGTQISRLEIEGATVLKRDAFAVNSTVQISGETWATQLWTFTIYPQREGVFSVPPLTINVKVSDSKGQPSAQSFKTSALEFNASIPKAISSGQDWVAANGFEVEESYNKTFDDLKKGDVIERKITLRAENLAAMMLPKVMVEQVDGLGIYSKPAVIDDKVNRGDYLASRVEMISYVIEEDGYYVIPAMQFYWWDLETNDLKVEELAELKFATKQTGLAKLTFWFQRFFLADEQNRIWLRSSIALSLVVGVSVLVWFFRRRIVPSKRNENQKLRQLQQDFLLSCKNEDFANAAAILYRWFDCIASVSDKSKGSLIRPWLQELVENTQVDAFEELMRYAYSSVGTSALNRKGGLSFDRFMRELERLSRKKGDSFSIKPIELTLN